jgi:hypothetical protein
MYVTPVACEFYYVVVITVLLVAQGAPAVLFFLLWG